jgi:hypothetical protein
MHKWIFTKITKKYQRHCKLQSLTACQAQYIPKISHRAFIQINKLLWIFPKKWRMLSAKMSMNLIIIQMRRMKLRRSYYRVIDWCHKEIKLKLYLKKTRCDNCKDRNLNYYQSSNKQKTHKPTPLNHMKTIRTPTTTQL